jgi:hypothetical protein
MFFLARWPRSCAHCYHNPQPIFLYQMQNNEFMLICLSRPLSDLSAAPLPESQGPGVSIPSLFGNSSRLNPLTLAASATGALLRAPNSVHSAQVMNRAGLRTHNCQLMLIFYPTFLSLRRRMSLPLWSNYIIPT